MADAYFSSSAPLRRRRELAHRRPEPPVISISAIAPSGTKFSTPVKAVPPGVTVVGPTSGGVVELDGETVVGSTVSEVVVEVSVVDVVDVVEVWVVEVWVVCVAVVVLEVVALVDVVVVVVTGIHWTCLMIGGWPCGLHPNSAHVSV